MDQELLSKEEILKRVLAGEKEYSDFCKARGMEKHISRVHPYEDVFGQAYILAIPSATETYKGEIKDKAFFTPAFHYIDDLVDQDGAVSSGQDFVDNRKDLSRLLTLIGKNEKDLASELIRRAEHPEGMKNGLHRMLYGGLIQQAEKADLQEKLLSEYRELSLQGIDKDLQEDIRKEIGLIPFWMTTKTVMSAMTCEESDYDPNRALCWDLIYAPALYCHDNKTEEEHGELNFFDRKLPAIEDMRNMIQTGVEHLQKYKNGRTELRKKQLSVLMDKFDSYLPHELKGIYEQALQEL